MDQVSRIITDLATWENSTRAKLGSIYYQARRHGHSAKAHDMPPVPFHFTGAVAVTTSN